MTSVKTAARYHVRSGRNALPQRVLHEQLPKERRYYAVAVGAGTRRSGRPVGWLN